MARVKLGLFDRFSKDHDHAAPAGPEAPTVVQIDATSLSRVFSAPMWLRDLGLVWLLGLTSTITVPVVLGAILATVAGPLVTALQRHGVPRAAGAAIVLL